MTEVASSPNRYGRRLAATLLLLVGAWLLAGVVTAGPASAHAELLSSTPANGAHVNSVPDAVQLRFSEHITLGPGYARVLDAHGGRVDTGAPRINGAVVTIPLRSGLPQGGYVVSYRVISADSHPVAGAYSFVVGAGSLVPTGAAAAANDVDPVIATALPAARWLGYGGLALAVGLPVLVAVCWPAGWASRRLARLAVWGAGAVAVGALAAFLLEGPYSAGSGPGSILDPALLRTTAGSSAGLLLLVRAGLAVIAAALLALTWRRVGKLDPAPGAVLAGLSIGMVATTAAIGHAAAGPWTAFALASTAVHVAAMAVWIGGLAGLLVGVLRPGVPVEQMARALPRFSRVSFGAVTALVISGVIQAIREVPSPSALFTTTYGWILVAKLLVLAVVLAAAGVSRVWVQQHYRVAGHRPDGRRRVTAQAFSAPAVRVGPAPDPDDDLPAFRRSVVMEFVLTVVILALSAVLVGTNPAAAATAPQPLDATLQLRGTAGPAGSVEVSLVPARPGPNSLHLYAFGPDGHLRSPQNIQVTVTDPGGEIGPLVVPLIHAGPGHYIAQSVSLPETGTWTLTVTERLDEFTAATASTRFPVR